MTTLQDIEAAAQRLEGIAHRTPILRSRRLDELVGGELHLKMESFQRSGAFKFRGAYNTLVQALPGVLEAGVITGSSGNHGGAVALAAQELGVPAVIVMPEDAASVKIAAVKACGAEVVLFGSTSAERIGYATDRAARDGMMMIPPYDYPQVIAGQGTVALEVIEQVPEFDLYLAPCGGGGLLGGSAVVLAAKRPEVEVWGVEATTADDTWQSLRRGERVTIELPDTIADGMRNLSPGELTFPLVKNHVRDIALVDDAAMAEAVALLATRAKVVVEPTGAAPVAALLSRKVDLAGRRAVAVISGGNVDPRVLAECLGVELS